MIIYNIPESLVVMSIFANSFVPREAGRCLCHLHRVVCRLAFLTVVKINMKSSPSLIPILSTPKSSSDMIFVWICISTSELVWPSSKDWGSWFNAKLLSGRTEFKV